MCSVVFYFLDKCFGGFDGLAENLPSFINKLLFLNNIKVIRKGILELANIFRKISIL